MTILTSIWAILEPLLFFMKFTSGLLPYSKFSVSQFDEHIDRAFDKSKEYIESYGLYATDFAPSTKDVYLESARNHFRFRNGEFTKLIDGQAEGFFFSQFILPTEKRFNTFLIHSYYLAAFKQKLFEYYKFRESILRRFSKNKSTLHYLSIPNWSTRKYDDLLNAVDNVHKIELKLNEYYKFQKLENIQASKVVSILDSVISDGKISTETIFKLASTEEIIIVNKYAEGFSDVYNSQNEERRRLNNEIKKINSKDKIGRKSIAKLDKLTQDLHDLEENWITVPIGRALEKKGFQKLFSKNDGIFFLPLSLIPSKYGKDYKKYLDEEIIKEAKTYYEYVRNSPYLINDHDGLSYMIISFTLTVDKLNVLCSNRDLQITTPHLSKMLFTSYFLTSKDNTAQLYINDVIRNVDFKSNLPAHTATGKYLHSNFDNLKNILWSEYQIDLYKPVLISSLTDQNIDDIVDRLTTIKDFTQPFRIKRLLKEQVVFYTELKKELDLIKVK